VAVKKKKEPEETKAPALKIVKRALKPERCFSHKFIVEADGRVDMAVSHEVTDDSICFNCGLYFSTWIWYSEKINASYWKGVDSEAGQALNFIAKQVETVKDRTSIEVFNKLLDKLRERRTKNGKRF
jgi:hypothetical protein